MTRSPGRPIFEIGPKNLLRLPAVEHVVRAAGAAGAEYGVDVVVTVPTAFVAPVVALRSGVSVFAQELGTDPVGPTFGSVVAEALVDVGAAGVMLDHDARRLDRDTLVATVARARDAGLRTIVCADTEEAAVDAAALGADVVLLEPPHLIGAAGTADRPWIRRADDRVRAQHPGVRTMHAGGVSTPEAARAVTAAGADGTGSTSGVLSAADPAAAARAFIAATRAGWDAARAPETDTATDH